MDKIKEIEDLIQTLFLWVEHGECFYDKEDMRRLQSMADELAMTIREYKVSED